MKSLFVLLLIGPVLSAFATDCGINGTIWHCAGDCPETCAKKSLACTRNCALIPCKCKPGYIIDESRRACVLRADCPKGIKQEVGPIYKTPHLPWGSFDIVAY
ncbi:uncharacterized protein Dwil_GK27126 [Drosophila willistoni]|uniref:TIL domain-containing protein n=1 Tax=Drosophila willistoni TaxID=7260 RepID=A0A0Q9WR08_DROWI|nr:uncharacterized protein Dwil_GK27126 [Drosophila willistoni]